MKNIEEDKLEQLLELIVHAPEIRIAHLLKNEESMVNILNNFCQKYEYEYIVNCTDNSFFDLISKKYSDREKTIVKQFSLDRRRYMMQGKMYEYLFVTCPIEEKIRGDFLKKSHSTIKNAGNILVFISKENFEDRYNWLELLEKNYYVASNVIDNLFEHYDVLISKKMHGWGG